MMRKSLYNNYSMITVCLCSLLIAGCGKESDKKASKTVEDIAPVPVRAVEVSRGLLEIDITAVGQVVERSRIEIDSEIPGVIKEVGPAPGEKIAEGDLIARIDDADLKHALETAKAGKVISEKAVDASRSALDARVVEINREIIGLKSERDKLQLTLEEQRRLMERKREVFRFGGATADDVENAERAYEKGRVELKAVWDQLEALGADRDDFDILSSPLIIPYKDAIEQSLAELKRAETEVATAQDRLKKTDILSPVNGIVLERNLDQGGRATTMNSKVATILETGKVFVEAFFDESVITSISTDDEGEIRIDALQGALMVGDIAEIKPEIDPGTRTFRARFELDNWDGRLIPGMFARIRMNQKRVKEALVIPRDALLTVGGTRGVFLVRDGTAFFKGITTGIMTEDEIEVLGGLDAGDIVAFEGHERLRDLDPVAASIEAKDSDNQ